MIRVSQRISVSRVEVAVATPPGRRLVDFTVALRRSGGAAFLSHAAGPRWKWRLKEGPPYR